jgi:hypothetical protein
MIDNKIESYIITRIQNKNPQTEDSIFISVKQKFKKMKETDEEIKRCIKINIIFQKIRNLNKITSLKEQN